MNQNFTINNIYNINYTDQDSVINNVIVGRPINNGVNELFSYRERDIIELAVNPNDPNIDDIFDMAFNNDDVSFTMGIDYRLLNRHVVDLLIDAYSHDNIRGIRILPRGKKLTSDIYNMLNIPELRYMLLSVDGVDDDVDLSSSSLDVRNGREIVTIENTKYTTREFYNINNYNIHITRELSDEELQYVVELLNKNRYQNIIVDFYEPTYYRHLLEFFSDKSIPSSVTFRFLANPLYDVAILYDGLGDILPNKIDIEYNTCNDLNDYYREEPISEGIRYYSDIEAGGRTDIDNYSDMLEMIDSIVRHMEEMNYSPMEKVAYLYDYFKEHYHYYDSGNSDNDSYLDRIYSKDSMICEGFSNLFSAILRRAGILCFTYGTDNHQKNIIRITDEKYGVDNIALIDPTWDLGVSGFNRNNFNNFLINIDNNLYIKTHEPNGNTISGESISIPTAFLLNHQDFVNNISNSNPGYISNPFGYGIRMLQLMGLDVDKSSYNPNDTESKYNAYRDALLNSNLIDDISSDVIADAVTNVREREGQYNIFDTKESDRAMVYNNVASRGYDHSQVPCIKTNGVHGTTINNIKLHVPKTNNNFVNIPAQNTLLNYPRSKQENESEEEYFNYLHDFYYSKFIGSDNNNVSEDVTIPNQSSNGSANESEEEEEEYMFEITNPNNVIEENNISSNNVQDEQTTPNTNNQEVIENNTPSNNVLIDQTTSNTVNQEVIENGEYIPGTNILKPRDIKPNESNEEYIEYLANYYEQHFPQQNTTSQHNSREIITLYSDESTNLLYVEDEIAGRFNLRSASFPAKIGDKLCYRITREDAEMLVNGRDDSVLPYDVVIKSFKREYERSDDEYNSFDNYSRRR